MKDYRLSLGLLSAIVLSASLAVGEPPTHSPPGRVAALEEAVAFLSATLDGVLPDTVPSGTIVAWSGLPGMLPEGWVLCDGENGTPDLHDRFIMGTALEEEMGEEGGSRQHDHVVQEHRHEVVLPYHRHEIPASPEYTTAEAGEHTHEMGPSFCGTRVHEQFGVGGVFVAGHPHTHTVHASGFHAHELQLPSRVTHVGDGRSDTSPAEAAMDDAEQLPPYYKLALIVKLEETAASAEDAPAALPARPLDRIESLEESVALISSTLDAALAYTVPERLVVMWSGSLDQLPEGWALCDGRDGTPDLRERFVMGAAGEEDLGEAGGSLQHTHSIRGHQHDVSLPPHAHNLRESTGVTEPIGDHVHEVLSSLFGDYVDERDTGLVSCEADHGHTMTPGGAHFHDVAIPGQSTLEAEGSSLTAPAASTMESASSLPPYYKLAFIAKLPRTGVFLPRAPTRRRRTNLIGRIAALEAAVATLSSTLDAAVAFLVPPETIAIWSQSSEMLPEGWVLCDGENGTPDLRGRFIAGAVVGEGEQGGANTHTHTFGVHAHVAYFPHSHADTSIFLRTDTGPQDSTGHGHETLGASTSFAADNFPGEVFVVSYLHGHSSSFDAGTIHEHDLTLTESIAAGGTDLQAETSEQTSIVMPAESVPPYYKAAFVMKLP
jgi:hypothetical protein